MIERSIKKNFDKFSPQDFTIIFKSYAKVKLANSALLNFFNYFIEKNKNNFGYFECVDIIINYPRLFNQKDFNYKLYFLLYTQTIQGIEKLEINRLVNLYFVFYSGNDKLIREKIMYEKRLVDLIISKEKNVKSKHIYLLFLTHHFSNITLNPELAHLLRSYIYKNMSLFLPEEINAIINIINDSRSKDLFVEIDLQLINRLYLKTLKQEIKTMDAQEIILYLSIIVPNESKVYR